MKQVQRSQEPGSCFHRELKWTAKTQTRGKSQQLNRPEWHKDVNISGMCVCASSETPAAVWCCSWDRAYLHAASSRPSVQPATTPQRSVRWGKKRTGQVSAAQRALLFMLWCLALRREILCEQIRFKKSVTVIHRRKTVVFIEVKMTQHGTPVKSIQFLIFRWLFPLFLFIYLHFSQ